MSKSKLNQLSQKEKLEKQYVSPKKALAYAVAAILIIYSCTIYIPPSWVTTVITLGALIITGFTALARVNDLAPQMHSKRWHARRLGLTFLGMGAVSMGGAYLVGYDGPPLWREVIFHVGLAITWITTPNMPPWWKWITRKDAIEDESIKDHK